MAITGRTALVAGLGALLAPLGTAWLGAVVALLAAGVLIDVALAGRVADLRMERSGGTGTTARGPCDRCVSRRAAMALRSSSRVADASARSASEWVTV